ncbi:type II toxin-antitoxin system RelE/ParE family toxin [Telmatobacter bradus]|uniref:type II toxin-antitoxin system RelE/ParE family toxin n=1 Tax=Telmatobacter bradus TaxID=474953 RepID=UPI003B4341E7
MKRTVVFTPEARDDLQELYDCIATHGSPARAIGFLQQIEEACVSLSTFAERGRLREDLRPGLRVMGFKYRVSIAFRGNPDEVAILRILYKGRSLRRALEG